MKSSKISIIVSAVLLFSIFHFPLSVKSQVRPIYDTGAIGLGQQLKRLQTTASAMHTGAHPDDEDSGLLAYLARKEQARTSYLSLNRGEGGQNVIGTELFEPLGVIRTEELLQARRLDGGGQFFTRVMDYGFSKTLAEASKIWGEKETLGDMVRAIRVSRPLVIISRFSGTPADGHGQHQFAGYLTPLAFKAAADPNQFPEQIAEGLQPWQAKKLYVSQGFAPNAANPTTLTLNTGEYDSLIGRSYFEIAMEGRTQHKSQEMGVLELRGKQISGMRLVENLGEKVETEKSVFDGIDTTLAAYPKLVGMNEDFLEGELKDAQKFASEALQNFDALNPSKIIEPLAKGLRAIRTAKRELAERGAKLKTDQVKSVEIMLAEKETEFSEALQTAAGVVVDALGDSETIIAGDSSTVAVRVFAPDNAPVKIADIALDVPEDWNAFVTAPPAKPTAPTFRPRDESAFDVKFFNLVVPPDAALTQPYWLDAPRRNFNFDWSANDPKNAPFQPALIKAVLKMNIGGEEITVVKDAQYRYADDIRGELRRDIAVVPRVSVTLDSNLIIAPVSAKSSVQKIVVSVTNNAAREAKGSLQLTLPSGWTAKPNAADFTLETRGEKTAVSFDISVPAKAKADDYKLVAQATVDGRIFDQMMRVVAYPHIQTHRHYQKAEITTKVLDLKIAPVRVGYIMGSGDKVPEAIRRLGLNVTMLEEKDLSTGDLSKFDTIVVGIRASQTRPDFVANNNRLLDFVKAGGTMIVQYQQQEYVNQNLPPFPAKMDTVINGNQRISNVRVTDENAKVTILAPANPVFNFPNKIGAGDWENWIQERNLYSFSTFDEKYTPLLEAHDEGEPEGKGAMVYAEIGRGKYVYTSYSWFRQLPNGNAGAYRIFANMLSLPKAGKK